MPRYITAAQYKKLTSIPRSKLSVRTKIFTGVIVEEKGKILMARDDAGHFPGLDIPGGKLLWGEEIMECAVREFMEETGYEVTLESLLGIYQRKASEDEDDYIRFVFTGKLKNHKQKKVTDPHVLETLWASIERIQKNKVKMKSPETFRELSEYFQGRRFPLSVIETYVW